jgi:hypothetical protein
MTHPDIWLLWAAIVVAGFAVPPISLWYFRLLVVLAREIWETM